MLSLLLTLSILLVRCNGTVESSTQVLTTAFSDVPVPAGLLSMCISLLILFLGDLDASEERCDLVQLTSSLQVAEVVSRPRSIAAAQPSMSLLLAEPAPFAAGVLLTLVFLFYDFVVE